MKIFFILMFLFVAPCARSAETETEARAKLAGTWAGRVESGASGHKLVITAERIRGTQNERRELGEGSYVLDLKQTPGWLDATSSKGNDEGQIYLGIFEVKGDTLRWCVSTPGDPRPKEFATKGSQFLLVLKKQ